MAVNIARSEDLPKLVGYQQLRELYGWPKRTVQDWIKARKFPKPLNLPGREKFWALDDIVAWMKGDMARVAVTRPEDLKPEQLAPTMRELGARLVASHIGGPVAPEQVSLSMTRIATNDEVTAVRGEFIEQVEYLCGHFDVFRAQLMAAAIFPALRDQWFETFDPGHLRDPKVLREFAADNCLDDERWAALNKAPAPDDAKAD
jgi:predicted DNA-binding transcriptional regulator AlpA